ncbi:MAG: hypothetical protein ABGX27_04520 [Desulfurobacteriaceae bacterium]
MMIDLEDFSSILESKKEKEEKDKEKKLTPEEIEKIYQMKFLELQREWELKLKETKKIFFEEGFKAGYEEGKNEAEKEYKKKVEDLQKDFSQRLQSLKLGLGNLEKAVNEKSQEVLKKIETLLLSSIEEILKFLYIDPKNAPYVANVIKDLLKEFQDEKLIEIEVGKGLKDFIDGEVKVAGDLADNDFRILFKDFSIEAKLKEKLNLLKDELEREIKKSS